MIIMQKLTTKYIYVLLFSVILFGINKGFSQTIKLDTLEIISISDINYKIEKSKRIISKIHFSTTDKAALYQLDSVLELKKSFFQNQADDFYSFNTENLSKIFLANTFKMWTEYDRRLRIIQLENSARFKKADNNTQNLIRIGREFKAVKLQLLKENDFKVIEDKVNDVLVHVEKKKSDQYVIIKKIIEVEDKLNNQVVFVNKILNYTQDLLDKKKVETFKHTNPYIWNVKFDDNKDLTIKSRFIKAFETNVKLILSELILVGKDIPTYFLYVLIIAFVIFRMRKFYLKLYKEDENLKIKQILVDHYKLVTSIVIILLLFVMFPSTPIIFSNSLAAILLLLVAKILKNNIGEIGFKLIQRFFIILVLYNLETIAWYFAGYARLYFMFEIIAAILLLTSFYVKYLKDTNFSETKKYNLIKKTIIIMIVAYVVSAIAQIFGFMNLSILLNKILIIIPTVTIIIYTAFILINVLIITVYKILVSKFSLFDELFPKFEKRFFIINKVIVVFFWIKTIASSFQLDRSFQTYITGVLDYSIVAAPYNLTVGNLLGFFIALILTNYIVSVISKVLSNKTVKSNKKAPRGFFSAISLTLRMIVIFIGLIFASSMIGVDMSKFSIMAGALGVGIGFGLQDIINNFISGLILIYGRPIQVGDAIEVKSLLGVVKHIGVRSSSLTTYDGAEVLVPNSLLISNILTNWTLSDNKKRMEVFLGVEYGSDPEEIIELMKQAASKVDIILKTPEPQALFLEFGDSSLNFRLRFWVFFENGYQAKSDVSIIINKMLADKKITIPFPQLDVHHLHDKKEKIEDDNTEDLKS